MQIEGNTLPPPNDCYADDMFACMNFTPQNVMNYMEVLDKFSLVANLTIERAKSTVAISKNLEKEEREFLLGMDFSNENFG